MPRQARSSRSSSWCAGAPGAGMLDGDWVGVAMMEDVPCVRNDGISDIGVTRVFLDGCVDNQHIVAHASTLGPRRFQGEGSDMALEGLHHITAITADAPRNVDFYARLLALRLVKKTVNFDAPDVYHLYYGDEEGTPGSILTFFEFPRAARGRAGAGMIHRLRWRVASRDSLEFWSERLAAD